LRRESLNLARNDGNAARPRRREALSTSPCCINVGRLYPGVPTINLTDDEHAAVAAAIRRAIDEDRFPAPPRLDPLSSALAKLEPATTTMIGIATGLLTSAKASRDDLRRDRGTWRAQAERATLGPKSEPERRPWWRRLVG
jgi:hypothetical protein